MKDIAVESLNIKCAKCSSEDSMKLIAREYQNFTMIDTYLCSSCGFKTTLNNNGEK